MDDYCDYCQHNKMCKWRIDMIGFRVELMKTSSKIEDDSPISIAVKCKYFARLNVNQDNFLFK